MAKKPKIERVFIDSSGNVNSYEGSSQQQRDIAAQNRISAPAMVQVAQTVKPTMNRDFTQPTIQTNNIRTVDTVNKQPKEEQDTLKEALKKYGDTIKNSATKNQGFNISNAISDISNLNDATKNVLKSIPGIGNYYKGKDNARKTAINLATNMGTGAVGTLEKASDAASDLVFNPIEQRYNYAFDYLTKGKKTADENLKDLKQMQERDIKRNRTEEFTRGYNDISDELEKGSAVKRDNILGQIAQGTGGMVPALVLGQAFGGAPELTDISNLQGKERLATALGNIGRTYMSQLPSNAILGASSYGSGMEEALNDGASMNRARAYGLTNAGIEQLTEMLTGGVPGLEGKGGIDQLVEPLINRNTNGYLNALLRAGYGALGEGLEESTGTYLDALAKRGILGQDIDWNEVNREALQSGLVGAATGAILNAPSTTQDFQNVRTENQLRNVLGDAEYAEGREQYNPDYKGWENQREENRIENEKRVEENTKRREEFERIQQQRQEEARKAQELAQEREKKQERIRQQEEAKRAQEAIKQPQIVAQTDGRKTQDIKEFKDVRNDYNQYYKKADMDNFDNTILNKAMSTIEGSKRYGRTKQEWLDVANNIGTQLRGQDIDTIKKYAFESFKDQAPNRNFNKQGKGTDMWGVHDWARAVYEGAKVNDTQQATQSQSSLEAVQSNVETEQQTPQVNNKQMQFDIISNTNPMQDEYHAGIRSENDIRTWNEVLNLDDDSEGQFAWGDYTRDDALRDQEKGTVTVYSSYPIENGNFVSTSKIQAEEYAGGPGSKVYSKEVPLNEVAWINGDEGQYAKVENNNIPAVMEKEPVIKAREKRTTKINNNIEQAIKNNYVTQKQVDKITNQVREKYKSLSDEQINKIIDLKVEQLKNDNIYSKYSNNERSRQRKMVNAYETNAEIRKIIQGDSLERVEGGLTEKELKKEIEKEKTNYIGKEVVVDGQKGKITDRPRYGKYPIELEDGTTITATKDEITPANDKLSKLNNKSSQNTTYTYGPNGFETQQEQALQQGQETTKIKADEKQQKIEKQPKVETKEEEKQYLMDNGMPEEKAQILYEMPKPPKETLSERIKNNKASQREEISYWRRNLVDKGETIYKIGKKTKNPNLYAKYDKRGTTTGEANYDIGVAQTDLKGKPYKNFTDANGKKTSMSLNQIWDGMDLKAANEYLAHYLNVDRYPQLNEDGSHKYVIGPSVTDEMSKQRISELEAEHPELKRFGENIWQYEKNQLQSRVEAGQISQAQANQFLKETPHYVHLQREIPKGSTTTIEFDKNGNAKVNKNIKEFKGSTLNILPFQDTMAQYTLDVRNSIRDNIFAQELAKTLGVGTNGETVENIEDIFGTNLELLRDNGDGTYSLTFFNKGTATVIPIDQGIYESLQPNKHYDFEDKKFFKAVRKVDNIRKALLTEKNPMFLATNMMKDAFDAPLNSKYPVLFAKNYPRAVYEILKNGQNYQQYQALGGLQNTYFDSEGYRKQGSKLNPLTWIEKANNAIEQIPRLAEFMSTMEKTGDVDQAMYNAAEVTTNFKRGGDVAKAANRNGFTFLNASIQGFDKQIRNFTDIQTPKQAVQMLGKVLVLGIAPGLLNDLMWDDDDEYKEMQDYQKDRYYLFKGKNGEWIRIPKGRAVSVFQSAARRTGYALKGQEDAFKDFGKFASGQIAPNNPFENNIISPIVDVGRNKSWSGNAIIPQSLEKKKAEKQYNEKTDKASRKISETINKSKIAKTLIPKNYRSAMGINYLMDQYSGAIGDIALPMITPKASSKNTNVLTKPVTDKFTTDAVYSNKSVNSFYDTMNKLAEEDETPIDIAKNNYMSSKSIVLSKLYKEQRNIQNDESLSKSEKYEQAREVQKQINAFTKQAVKDVKNIEEEEYYLKIGDSYYKKVIEDGETKYKQDTSKKIPVGDKYALYDYFRKKYEKSKE